MLPIRSISAVLFAALSLLTVYSPRAHAASILCEGVCSPVGASPTHGTAPFEFVFGLAAEEGDELMLVATGSIYVFGSILATGLVTIDAGVSVAIDGGSIDAGGQAGSGLPPLLFEVDGDAYLDVAGVSLGDLAVVAGVDIVIDANDSVVFTPEPGTGVLLASNLALLAARRPRRS